MIFGTLKIERAYEANVFRSKGWWSKTEVAELGAPRWSAASTTSTITRRTAQCPVLCALCLHRKCLYYSKYTSSRDKSRNRLYKRRTFYVIKLGCSLASNEILSSSLTNESFGKHRKDPSYMACFNIGFINPRKNSFVISIKSSPGISLLLPLDETSGILYHETQRNHRNSASRILASRIFSVIKIKPPSSHVRIAIGTSSNAFSRENHLTGHISREGCLHQDIHRENHLYQHISRKDHLSQHISRKDLNTSLGKITSLSTSPGKITSRNTFPEDHLTQHISSKSSKLPSY